MERDPQELALREITVLYIKVVITKLRQNWQHGFKRSSTILRWVIVVESFENCVKIDKTWLDRMQPCFVFGKYRDTFTQTADFKRYVVTDNTAGRGEEFSQARKQYRARIKLSISQKA